MPFYAGLDWSGTPYPKQHNLTHDLYVPCVAAVNSFEGLKDAFTGIRTALHLPSGGEFHGHLCSDELQLTILRVAVELDLRVGAILYDKLAYNLHEDSFALPPPAMFPPLAALRLLENFLPLCPLIDLWFDTDIEGKKRQLQFITGVKRLNRHLYPAAKLKVRPKSSKSNELIQLADIVAYGLSRLARGLVEHLPLRLQLEIIRNGTTNTIAGPYSWRQKGDDLRPYLG